jgi:hypothetical protein
MTPSCSGDEFEVGVTEVLTCGNGEVDLGEGLLMQDHLHRLGDVEANDLRQHSPRIGEESVAEGGVGGDALSDHRLDLGTGGDSHELLLYRWSES